MNPKVSVVIPCYHQTQYLDDCIRSVLAQTYEDFEIIVVDDGNVDEKDMSFFNNMNYPKTRIIHQINRGLAAARNFGIENARGEYILPLDADDKITPNFLALTVPVLDKNPKVGICGGKTELFGDRTGVMNLLRYSLRAILLQNRLVCTHLFRRCDWKVVGGYNENMIYGLEDWDFWLSLIELKREVVQLDEVLFRYRKHGVSMVSELSKNDNVMKMRQQLVANHAKLYDHHWNYRNYLLYGKGSWKGYLAGKTRGFLCRLRLNHVFKWMYSELCLIP